MSLNAQRPYPMGWRLRERPGQATLVHATKHGINKQTQDTGIWLICQSLDRGASYPHLLMWIKHVLKFDRTLIRYVQRISPILSRLALATVFFWFGLLKVLGLSPAMDLVHALFDQTLSAITPLAPFYVFFAWFEVLIGWLFLFPKTERYVTPLLLIHMATTFLPLILLPNVAWTAPFVPTLEGQYIIKNLVIVALALVLVSKLRPLDEVKV